MTMGSDGNKPRKQKRSLAKVPRHEEPNTLVGMGGSGGVGFGRSGHGSDRHGAGKPGRAGSFLLKLLGKRPKQ
jgi:hypothetical protein